MKWHCACTNAKGIYVMR